MIALSLVHDLVFGHLDSPREGKLSDFGKMRGRTHRRRTVDYLREPTEGAKRST